MGILRNKEQRYEPIRIEDLDEEAQLNNYDNYLFDSDFSEDSDDEKPNVDGDQRQVFVSHRRKKSKKPQTNYSYEIVDGLHVKRNMGAQKWRRVESAKILMRFTDTQDVCVDGSDLMPETITAFTRLLRDEAKMKIWNEFIEKNEAEQVRMIRRIENELLAGRDGMKDKPTTSMKSNRNVGHREDSRKVHPAFSAENCFQRMDKKFRNCFLKRRYVQLDYMDHIESILRKFFHDSVTGVYVEEVDSAINRFYIHAVAQFLQLKSQSIQAGNMRKMVQVENEKSQFEPPDSHLANYLRKLRRANKKKSANEDEEWEDFDYDV